MKLITFIMAVTGLSFFYPAFSQNNTSQEEAIRSVIEQETRAYYEGNVEKWADIWVHDPACYVIFTGPNDNTELIGWEKILSEYKMYMQNSTPIDEEQYKIYARKYDYRFKINGSMALVTLRENKGDLGTRLLEKQNGNWKMVGITSVSSAAYKFMESVKQLKPYVGKWVLDTASMKIDPPVKGYSSKYWNLDIHQTENGFEMVTDQAYTYINKPYNPPLEHEQIMPDYSQYEFKYIDLQKSESGLTYVSTGTATIDSSGSLNIKQMYHNKPTAVEYENTYMIGKDGILHITGKNYNSDGKLVTTAMFDLHRQ